MGTWGKQKQGLVQRCTCGVWDKPKEKRCHDSDCDLIIAMLRLSRMAKEGEVNELFYFGQTRTKPYFSRQKKDLGVWKVSVETGQWVLDNVYV